MTNAEGTDFVPGDWNEFRRATRDSVYHSYVTHYRREFFEMLADDPSCISALYQMKARMEERHGRKRDYFGYIYLETEKELERKARRAFQNATTPGGAGFEVDGPGKDEHPASAQMSGNKGGDWQWGEEVDTTESHLNRAAYWLEESLQLSERYIRMTEAVELMENRGVEVLKQHLELMDANQNVELSVHEKRGSALAKTQKESFESAGEMVGTIKALLDDPHEREQTNVDTLRNSLKKLKLPDGRSVFAEDLFPSGHGRGLTDEKRREMLKARKSRAIEWWRNRRTD